MKRNTMKWLMTSLVSYKNINENRKTDKNPKVEAGVEVKVDHEVDLQVVLDHHHHDEGHGHDPGHGLVVGDQGPFLQEAKVDHSHAQDHALHMEDHL